jgi:hypothetical protein
MLVSTNSDAIRFKDFMCLLVKKDTLRLTQLPLTLCQSPANGSVAADLLFATHSSGEADCYCKESNEDLTNDSASK